MDGVYLAYSALLFILMLGLAVGCNRLGKRS